MNTIDNIFAWHDAQGRDESGNAPVIITKAPKDTKETQKINSLD